jgi:hypothetical protein
MSTEDLRTALAEADRIMCHDDDATEWREKWAHLWGASSAASTEDLSDERAAWRAWYADRYGYFPRIHTVLGTLIDPRPIEVASMDAYLAGRASSAAAVPGWKLVPVTPTIRQMAAMGPAIRACFGLDGKTGDVSDVYASMLAATPAPPQAVPAEPVAWMHPDGRVVPAATKANAERDGGAMRSSLAGYTVPLYTAPGAAPPQADHFPEARKMVAPQAVPATDAEPCAFPACDCAPITPGRCKRDPTQAAPVLRAPAAPVAVDAADVPDLREAVEQLIACHDEPTCPAIEVARAALRAAGAGSRELLTDVRLVSLLEDWLTSFSDCIEGGEADELVTFTRAAIDAARGKA